MAKGKYIKVTDKNQKSTVVMSANESFYKSQGYKIGEPTQKEIELYFPNEKETQNVESENNETELTIEIERLQADLREEKAERISIGNQLNQAKEAHAEILAKYQALEADYNTLLNASQNQTPTEVEEVETVEDLEATEPKKTKK